MHSHCARQYKLNAAIRKLAKHTNTGCSLFICITFIVHNQNWLYPLFDIVANVFHIGVPWKWPDFNFAFPYWGGRSSGWLVCVGFSGMKRKTNKKKGRRSRIEEKKNIRNTDGHNGFGMCADLFVNKKKLQLDWFSFGAIQNANRIIVCYNSNQ